MEWKENPWGRADGAPHELSMRGLSAGQAQAARPLEVNPLKLGPVLFAILGINVLAGVQLHAEFVVTSIERADEFDLCYILKIMEKDSVPNGRAFGLGANPLAVVRVHVKFAVLLHWTAAKFAFASGVLAVAKDLSLRGNMLR